MPAPTAFALWLEAVNLSTVEAAERLGVHRNRVGEWRAGRCFSRRDRPAEPDTLTRYAMAAIAAGLVIPEDIARECVASNDRRLALALAAARAGLEPWPVPATPTAS